MKNNKKSMCIGYVKHLCIGGLIIIMSVTGVVFAAADTVPALDLNPQIEREASVENTADAEAVAASVLDLKQQLDATGLNIDQLKASIEISEATLKDRQADLSALEGKIEAQQEALGRTFNAYQRVGTASYVEMLLSSNNLGDFIWKLNALKSLSDGVNTHLSELNASVTQAQDENQALTDQLKTYKDQKQSLETLSREQEKELTSLKATLERLKSEQLEAYEAYQALNARWEAAADAVVAFNSKMTEALEHHSLSSDQYQMRFSLSGLQIVISETALNDILGWAEDPGVSLQIEQDSMVLNFEPNALQIEGHFDVDSESNLVFKGDAGRFEGRDIDEAVLSTLLSVEPLSIPLGEGYKVKQIDTNEGNLIITLSF